MRLIIYVLNIKLSLKTLKEIYISICNMKTIFKNLNLIEKNITYETHPCAEIIKQCKYKNYEDFILLFTKSRFIPKLDDYTTGGFIVKNKTSVDDENKFELSVVENVIFHKFKVWCLSKETVLLLCPEYLHFNSKIIEYMVIRDLPLIEEYRRRNDPYYGTDDPYAMESEYDKYNADIMKEFYIKDDDAGGDGDDNYDMVKFIDEN